MDLLNDSSDSQHQWVSILSPLDVNIQFLEILDEIVKAYA